MSSCLFSSSSVLEFFLKENLLKNITIGECSSTFQVDMNYKLSEIINRSFPCSDFGFCFIIDGAFCNKEYFISNV